MNRNYVYAFKSPYRSCNVINYAATKNEVNSFLHNFDIWNCRGIFKPSEDKNHQEVWFECNLEFFDMLHTETMKRAFERMGVKLVFDYPFMEEFQK